MTKIEEKIYKKLQEGFILVKITKIKGNKAYAGFDNKPVIITDEELKLKEEILIKKEHLEISKDGRVFFYNGLVYPKNSKLEIKIGLKKEGDLAYLAVGHSWLVEIKPSEDEIKEILADMYSDVKECIGEVNPFFFSLEEDVSEKSKQFVLKRKEEILEAEKREEQRESEVDETYRRYFQKGVRRDSVRFEYSTMNPYTRKGSTSYSRQEVLIPLNMSKEEFVKEFTFIFDGEQMTTNEYDEVIKKYKDELQIIIN